MKKILLATVLILSGCSCICPVQPVHVMSNEKNTNIYYNNEFIGADNTYAVLRNKNVEKSYFKGEKKGCETQVINIEHHFDFGVLNIFDLRNVFRLLAWDVYRVDRDKKIYNVTPRC